MLETGGDLVEELDVGLAERQRDAAGSEVTWTPSSLRESWQEYSPAAVRGLEQLVRVVLLVDLGRACRTVARDAHAEDELGCAEVGSCNQLTSLASSCSPLQLDDLSTRILLEIKKIMRSERTVQGDADEVAAELQ